MPGGDVMRGHCSW